MPIYEYACESCQHAFDVLQKMDAAPLSECPECGQPTLKKLLSAPNFRLKGGGWYETDFKKDNQRNLADDASRKDKKDEKGKDEKGKDTKSKDQKGEGNTKDKKSTDTGKSASGKSATGATPTSKSGSSGAKSD